MKLSKPEIVEFKLKTDPDGEAVVRIRQATTDDMVARDAIFSRMTSDSAGTHQYFNPKEIYRMEAYRVIASITGILLDEEEVFQSKELSGQGERVRHAMSEKQFFKAWGMLPPDVTKEIVDYVHEVNPVWDNRTGE